MAADNKSLGRFSLDGIPSAPRGVPQIEVTFDIDANGILKVTAQDKATGRSQHITITASSGLSESEIDKMRQEAEAHADDDKKRKDLIEARNHADNLIYTTEKTIRDLGDKVPADMKTKADEAANKLKEVMKSDDTEAIKKSTDELGQILQGIGTAAYQQSGPAAGAPGGDAGPADGSNGGQTPPGGEDVVDGEFKSV
jgi:molecular chaperone DnaK